MPKDNSQASRAGEYDGVTGDQLEKRHSDLIKWAARYRWYLRGLWLKSSGQGLQPLKRREDCLTMVAKYVFRGKVSHSMLTRGSTSAFEGPLALRLKSQGWADSETTKEIRIAYALQAISAKQLIDKPQKSQIAMKILGRPGMVRTCKEVNDFIKKGKVWEAKNDDKATTDYVAEWTWQKICQGHCGDIYWKPIADRIGCWTVPLMCIAFPTTTRCDMKSRWFDTFNIKTATLLTSAEVVTEIDRHIEYLVKNEQVEHSPDDTDRALANVIGKTWKATLEAAREEAERRAGLNGGGSDPRQEMLHSVHMLNGKSAKGDCEKEELAPWVASIIAYQYAAPFTFAELPHPIPTVWKMLRIAKARFEEAEWETRNVDVVTVTRDDYKNVLFGHIETEEALAQRVKKLVSDFPHTTPVDGRFLPVVAGWAKSRTQGEEAMSRVKTEVNVAQPGDKEGKDQPLELPLKNTAQDKTANKSRVDATPDLLTPNDQIPDSSSRATEHARPPKKRKRPEHSTTSQEHDETSGFDLRAYAESIVNEEGWNDANWAEYGQMVRIINSKAHSEIENARDTINIKRRRDNQSSFDDQILRMQPAARSLFPSNRQELSPTLTPRSQHLSFQSPSAGRTSFTDNSGDRSQSVKMGFGQSFRSFDI